eukprot:767137-Hanusia_phi.AAC.19
MARRGWRVPGLLGVRVQVNESQVHGKRRLRQCRSDESGQDGSKIVIKTLDVVGSFCFGCNN